MELENYKELIESAVDSYESDFDNAFINACESVINDDSVDYDDFGQYVLSVVTSGADCDDYVWLLHHNFEGYYVASEFTCPNTILSNLHDANRFESCDSVETLVYSVMRPDTDSALDIVDSRAYFDDTLEAIDQLMQLNDTFVSYEGRCYLESEITDSAESAIADYIDDFNAGLKALISELYRLYKAA